MGASANTVCSNRVPPGRFRPVLRTRAWMGLYNVIGPD